MTIASKSPVLPGDPPLKTRIWIRTEATTAGVAFTVDDDGPGIPQADRQRVIEPFRQGVGAAIAAQPGTGIGLSLVHAFVRLHRGELTERSHRSRFGRLSAG